MARFRMRALPHGARASARDGILAETSEGAALIGNLPFPAQVTLELLQGVLNHILKCFEPSHDSCDGAVLIELQDEIGLVFHDVLVEMLDERVCSATEIRQVKAESVGPFPNEFGRSQDLGPKAPVHIREILQINGGDVEKIHGHGCHADLGEILPEPQIEPFVMKIVGPPCDYDQRPFRVMGIQNLPTLPEQLLHEIAAAFPNRTRALPGDGLWIDRAFSKACSDSSIARVGMSYFR